MEETTIIAIDESGVHLQDGKSVIALIYVDEANAEDVEQIVLDTERLTGIHGFHWARRNWRMRTTFVEGIAKADFRIKLAYVANPVDSNTAIAEVLRLLLTEHQISQILIDGSKHQAYTRQIKKVLRDKGIKVRKVRMGNDESFPLIRIADAVAGVARMSEDANNQKANSLFRLLSHKIETVVTLHN